MTIDYALNLFELPTNPTKEEALKRYRHLVKRYHPDSNTNNEIFSHLMMTKINNAYALIMKHIQHREQESTHIYTPQRQPTHHHAPDVNTTENTRDEQGADEPEYNEQEYSDTYPLSIPISIKPFVQFLCSGICDYYSYNLYNIPLRRSGSTHSLYYGFLRKFHNALRQLHAQYDRHGSASQSTRLLLTFFNSFLDNARLSFFFHHQRNRIANQLNTLYVQSSAHIDTAIRLRYCIDVNHAIRTREQSVSYEQLVAARRNLISLGETAAFPAFRHPAKIKTKLMDDFLCSFQWNFESDDAQ